jgi:exoribonuclease R
MQWISGTLELTSKVRYGLSSHGHPLFRFIPYDRRWAPFAVASSLRDFSTNIHAIIEPLQAKGVQIKGTMPKGSIVQLLGQPSEHSEKAMLLMSYAYDSTKELRKIIPSPPTSFSPEDRETVEGFTFHIDPPGCKDVDDAFTFRKTADGWKVYIHISDVDAWIPAASATDAVARRRASTFYSLEGKALAPMFPPAISEQSATLLPDPLPAVDGQSQSVKPALSLAFTWTEGRIEDAHWAKTLIRCDRSFTYDEATELVDTIPELAALRDLSAQLSPEDNADAHLWVQSLMILYNTRAGMLLREKGKGILRRHSAKKKELLTKVNQTGFSFMGMYAAEYVDARDDDVAHAGLDKEAYAYATSPIRRYCDLVNQRYIKDILSPADPPFTVDIAPLVAELNRRQKQEKAFTRDLFFMKVLSDSVKEVDGVAVSEKRVWIPEWKRCITVKKKVIEGEKYKVTWYENRGLPHWKERIVFRADAV